MHSDISSVSRGEPSEVRRGTRTSGFTSIELIMVMVILAILAAVAIPAFVSSPDINNRAAAEILVSDIRWAQSLAIRQNSTNITFTTSATGYVVIDGSGTPVKQVAFGTGDYRSLSGITLTTTTFTFDRCGTPSAGQDIGVTAGGETVHVIVAAQTGRAGVQ